MNNRFKFRAWNKLSNEMKDVISLNINYEFPDCSNVVLETNTFDDIKTHSNPITCANGLNNVVLMQCTGLKDKNGKLIYEGDIVRFKDCNDILVINYQKEMACFAPQFYCNGKYGGRLCFDDYDSFECQFYKSNNFEVIGNIYENKELLEEECQK